MNVSIKVSDGLVGISLNEAARSYFFLMAPEPARLAQEAKTLVSIKIETVIQHHESYTAFERIQNDRVMKLNEEKGIHTNPLYSEGDDLLTLVTKAVMLEKVTQDLTDATPVVFAKHTSFVKSRITSNTENIWAQ